MKFILWRFKALEAAADTSMKKRDVAAKKETDQQYKSNCKHCNSAHNIYACTKFKCLPIKQQYNFAKKQNYFLIA